jgi:hypothetical protein
MVAAMALDYTEGTNNPKLFDSTPPWQGHTEFQIYPEGREYIWLRPNGTHTQNTQYKREASCGRKCPHLESPVLSSP